MKPRTVFVDFELVDTTMTAQEIRDAVVMALDRVRNDSDSEAELNYQPGTVRQFHTNIADATKPKPKLK